MPATVDPHTRFFDKSFNETQTPQYILSIQFGLYGLVLSVYDPAKNKFIVLESFRFTGLKKNDQIAGKINAVVNQHAWLKKPFKKTNILFAAPGNTLVPEALFSEEEKETYLHFNQAVQQDASVHFNRLKNTGAVNIFPLPDPLFHTIQTCWPAVPVMHFSGMLIESLLINYKNKADSNTMFVQLHRDFFEIVNLREGKLFFHNSFMYKSKEDFIYFLLATMEQLKLNPETAKLILLGEIDKNTAYYEMIFRYIRDSEFIERQDTFNYSYLLDKIAHHKYYVLFNALQCE